MQRTVCSVRRQALFRSFSSVREDILTNAMKHVPTYGWKDECLAKATVELGLPPLSHRIVERGAPELVQYFLNKKADKVANEMQKEQAQTEDAYSPDNLCRGIELHIDYLLPYRSVLAEAIALSISPSELPYTLTHATRVADDLCYFSGIRNARLDWYQERAAVLALYGSVELFFLTDSSDNAQETRY